MRRRAHGTAHHSSGTNSLLDQRRTEPRRTPSKVAVVVTDPVTGRRVCPECKGPLEKKNPHGPGRYPSRCESCRVAARVDA